MEYKYAEKQRLNRRRSEAKPLAALNQDSMFQRELRVPIEKVVRQGDTISPKLYTTAPKHAMLQLGWDDKGINIDGKKLSSLRFADDIVLISLNREELQQMVEEWTTSAKPLASR
uniref:Reverse transcriptase domain-containing protein n=1 Tax=Haemonchus contortus TaxID=6289 RepID=A0A7I4YL34_HAECO